MYQEEKEPVESVLKIVKVFCGEEAFKIDNLNLALADVVFDSLDGWGGEPASQP